MSICSITALDGYIAIETNQVTVEISIKKFIFIFLYYIIF